MKKILFLLMFVSSLSFGQIIIKQSNKVNFYETIYVATNGSNPADSSGYVAKFLSNGDMYLKPNTPVVGYVLTAVDTNGKATWQAASGGGYSPWDTTATAIVQKDTALYVGVNTTVPLEPFDVRGGFLMVQGDLFTGSVDLVQISGDTALYPFVTMQHSVPNGQVNAGNRSVEMDSISGGGVYIRANNGGIGAQTDLAIRGQGIYMVDQTNGDTLVFVEQATNRVGINSTAPEQALDVSGSVKIDSTLILTGIYFTDTDSVFTIPSGLATALSWKAGGGAWVSGTVTLPANPVNGQLVAVSGDWVTVSLAASGGASVASTPTAGQFRHGTKFIYRAADTTWYPW